MTTELPEGVTNRQVFLLFTAVGEGLIGLLLLLLPAVPLALLIGVQAALPRDQGRAG